MEGLKMIMDLIPLIGGGVFGAVVKLFSLSMENKRQQTDMLISLNQTKQKSIDSVNQVAENNPWFAWTRRVLALSVTLMLGSLIFLPFLNPNIPINIMTTTTDGGSYLFGLIDTKTSKEIWVQLKGIVFHPVVADAFLAIIGAYFGASISTPKGR